MGHSRLGKAALWAGVQDTRFALVISNESGSGGAALHKRIYGETVGDITRVFPHWFTSGSGSTRDTRTGSRSISTSCWRWSRRGRCTSRRPQGDQWADPKGEFLSAQNADPVYRLLGTDGLGVAGDAARRIPPSAAPSAITCVPGRMS